MKMPSLFKKKKNRTITSSAPSSGIYNEQESFGAEGSDKWKVIDIDDDIFDNLKEQETPSKKSITKKKTLFKKKSLSKKKSKQKVTKKKKSKKQKISKKKSPAKKKTT